MFGNQINSCMATVINDQIYTNILDLPPINEITNGNYLIVETEDGTNIIDFENFIVGVSNITFEPAIESNTTNIATLSADLQTTNDEVTAVKGVLNGMMTVGYSLSGAADGVSFSTTEYVLPVNYIQSNSIDGNLGNAPSTLNGVTSGSNLINLNPGSYQVTLNAGFSGGAVFVDLYDNTNNQVLLTSDYSENPTIQGIVSLAIRSDLSIRAYTDTTRNLGTRSPFYVDGLVQMPLKATFQYLSAGAFDTHQPDTRS